MSMTRRSPALAASAILAALILTTACDGTLPTPAEGNGRLKLLVTDKPFPFEFIESAVVTLTEVRVRQAAETQADESDEETGDDDGTWITLFEDPAGKPLDLIDLRNGRTDLLADVEIPAGTYTQMRLVVTGGEVVLTDGRSFPLKVPSGDTSGIKLHFTFEVVDGEETMLLLDVDLSRAFRPIPAGKIDTPDQIQQFHFHPSIAMRLINLLEAGSISGLVTDSDAVPIAGAAVTAYKDDVEVTSTATEPDGSYTLLGLTTGDYRIAFSAAGYADAEITDVSVTAGQETTDVNATLTPAE